jgi:hypothetical protein
MTTFIVGHGELAADRPETIVPEGMSIGFWTDLDFNLVMANGMAAVWSGDVGSAAETYKGGDPVPNYGLSPLTDNQRVRFETVAQEGLSVWYVGDQLPADVHLCDGDDVMCNNGRHICGGVFGRIDDTEIIYLSCRGVEGAEDKDQEAYGGTGDTTLNDTLDRLYGDLMTMSEEDRGRWLNQMEDARDPDQQEQLAFLMTYPDLRKAALKQRTAEYLASADQATFEAFFAGQPQQEQEWMLEVPGVVETVTLSERERMFDEGGG